MVVEGRQGEISQALLFGLLTDTSIMLDHEWQFVEYLPHFLYTLR